MPINSSLFNCPRFSSGQESSSIASTDAFVINSHRASYVVLASGANDARRWSSRSFCCHIDACIATIASVIDCAHAEHGLSNSGRAGQNNKPMRAAHVLSCCHNCLKPVSIIRRDVEPKKLNLAFCVGQTVNVAQPGGDQLSSAPDWHGQRRISGLPSFMR